MTELINPKKIKRKKLKIINNKPLKFIDLFCGIGGFHQALSKYNAKCVLACDIDKHCRTVYANNYGITPKEDVTKLDPNTMSDFDILCGGFPCQAFSNAGKKNTFSDSRGLLFDEIIRIVKVKKPKFIFLENVKHIMKVGNGKVIEYIKNQLDSSNYNVQIFNMSPHNYGIPQQRERIYFVCVRKDIYKTDIELCIPKTNSIEFKDFLDKKEDIDNSYFLKGDILDALNAWDNIIKQIKPGDKISPTIMINEAIIYKDISEKKLVELCNKSKEIEIINKKIKILESVIKKLSKKKVKEDDKSSKDLNKLNKEKEKFIKSNFDNLTDLELQFINFASWRKEYIIKNKFIYNKYKKEWNNWHEKYKSILTKREIFGKLEWQVGEIKENDSIFNYFIQIRQSGIRVRKANYFPTLVAISQIPIYGKEKRYITPKECLRLQSFPDNFKLLEDKHSYKQLGNCVNVNNVNNVIKSTLKHYGYDHNYHKQTTGMKRKTIDKFYTSLIIVNKCINLIQQNINIGEDDLCIEPSAGDGAFINGIKSLFKNYKFYDLEPENNAIIEQDYLEYDETTIIKKPNSKIHIIGNPPFGRQSSLAIKFIKKSCKYCDSISFILPKSFKKDSLKKHFPINFHLISEYDLPKNSFIINKKEYDVPCVFQIWEKKNYSRPVPEKLVPNKFKFVKKKEKHDISFRRVGINAGDIDKNTVNKSDESHYFIKFDVKLTDNLFNKLSNIKYPCKDDTCGPKSISKQELIKEFNIYTNLD